ncbi:MAG: hypothetical protein K940chlam9_00197 [Chlamydiae bacterium]|nr:hypothetical protein [Chlamydiota bacterium]
MKKTLSLLCILLTAFALPLRASSNTFQDYQNYNHGYCPSCNCSPCGCGADGACPEEPYPTPCEEEEPCGPCDPCGPVCGAECGISLCAIGVGAAAIVIAGVIILTSGDGEAGHFHSASDT